MLRRSHKLDNSYILSKRGLLSGTAGFSWPWSTLLLEWEASEGSDVFGTLCSGVSHIESISKSDAWDFSSRCFPLDSSSAKAETLSGLVGNPEFTFSWRLTKWSMTSILYSPLRVLDCQQSALPPHPHSPLWQGSLVLRRYLPGPSVGCSTDRSDCERGCRLDSLFTSESCDDLLESKIGMFHRPVFLVKAES